MVGMPAPATVGPEPVMEKKEAPLEEVREGAEVTVREEADVVEAELESVVEDAEDESVEDGVLSDLEGEALEELPERVAVERLGRSVCAIEGSTKRKAKSRIAGMRRLHILTTTGDMVCCRLPCKAMAPRRGG